MRTPVRLAAGFLLISTLTLGCESTTSSTPPDRDASRGGDDGLVLGVLLDETGLLGTFGSTGRPGVELALDHLNEAGGVFGLPVTAAYADTRTDVKASVEAARSLSEAGVHAFVGPLGSAATMAVVRLVSAPQGLPTISPTATSPDLSSLPDRGFLFRTTASDLVQAPVLADLARQEGARHVAAFHQDDSYGRGLERAFRDRFDGDVLAVPVQADQASFVEQLEEAAHAGADTLIAMSYVPTAVVYLREAIDRNLFERVLLVDATASIDLVDELGADVVEGMKGTAPSGTVPLPASRQSAEAERFEADFTAHFGRAPTNQLEGAAYDITVCLGLAAAHAKSTEGAAIRDALPSVCGGRGEIYGPGTASVTQALEAATSGSDVAYRGASGDIAWDAHGDLAVGSILIWQFRSGQIAEIGSVPFDLRATNPS